MRKFFNIFKKELRELITLRTLIPFVMAMLILVLVGRIAKGEMRRVDRPLKVSVVDLDQTASSENLINALRDGGFVITLLLPADRDSMVKTSIAQNARVLIVIPQGFEAAISRKEGTTIEFYSIIKSFSIYESVKRASINNLLVVMNQQISDKYIKEFSKDLDSNAVKNPIKPQEYVVFRGNIGRGNAQMMMSLIMSQNFMIPVILLMLIILTGTMIATSIGQEKENKTLETLMTVPVSRISIVSAKMLAAAVLALIFAAFYMLAMGSYMSSMIPTEVANRGLAQAAQHISSNLGLRLDFKANLLLGMNIFLAIIAALSMSTVLALFAKDAKDAQATISPLMVIVLLPYFFSMFIDPETASLSFKIIIFIIPFSHTFFAYKFLLMGKYGLVIGGVIYLAAFSIFLLYLAGKIFSSDKLFTAKFTLFSLRGKKVHK